MDTVGVPGRGGGSDSLTVNCCIQPSCQIQFKSSFPMKIHSEKLSLICCVNFMIWTNFILEFKNFNSLEQFFLPRTPCLPRDSIFYIVFASSDEISLGRRIRRDSPNSTCLSGGVGCCKLEGPRIWKIGMIVGPRSAGDPEVRKYYSSISWQGYSYES